MGWGGLSSSGGSGLHTGPRTRQERALRGLLKQLFFFSWCGFFRIKTILVCVFSRQVFFVGGHSDGPTRRRKAEHQLPMWFGITAYKSGASQGCRSERNVEPSAARSCCHGSAEMTPDAHVRNAVRNMHAPPLQCKPGVATVVAPGFPGVRWGRHSVSKVLLVSCLVRTLLGGRVGLNHTHARAAMN